MEILKAITTNEEKITLEKARGQQLKQLFHSSICILTALILTVSLMLAGCESDVPKEQCPPVQLVEVFHNPESSENLRTLPPPKKLQIRVITFDSFGIAFDASVVGEIIEETSEGGDSSLVAFSGTGLSALLGEIDITQRHYVDLSSNEISGGRFTFEGKNGEIVSGTYEGSRSSAGEGFTIHAKAKVTGGAVECTPLTSESGWGWINGSLKKDRLNYQLDGWLFHHAEEKEES